MSGNTTNLEKIQQVTDKEEVKCVLQKHFDKYNETVEKPVNIYFSERLVEDLMKLRLSSSRDPDKATCHLGISILAVPTVSVMERLRRDEETNAVEKSTTHTVAEVKARRKGPPPIPTQYEPGMRLLR